MKTKKKNEIHLIIGPAGRTHRAFTSKRSANSYVKAMLKHTFAKIGWRVETVSLHKTIKGLV